MKTIARQIEKLFIEITFAEEREMAPLKDNPSSFVVWFDNLFAAITFAEAGELDTARVLMGSDSGDSKRSIGSCLSDFCAGRA